MINIVRDSINKSLFLNPTHKQNFHSGRNTVNHDLQLCGSEKTGGVFLCLFYDLVVFYSICDVVSKRVVCFAPILY